MTLDLDNTQVMRFFMQSSSPVRMLALKSIDVVNWHFSGKKLGRIISRLFPQIQDLDIYIDCHNCVVDFDFDLSLFTNLRKHKVRCHHCNFYEMYATT